MPNPLQPATAIIAAFDGVRPLARELGVAPSTVSRWTKPRNEGGTGGAIPTKHQSEILALAKRRRKKITAANLIKA